MAKTRTKVEQESGTGFNLGQVFSSNKKTTIGGRGSHG